MMYKIYQAKFPNGKIYIGMTKQRLAVRANGHRQDSKRYANKNIKFYNAMTAYGFKNITWSILVDGLPDRKSAAAAERELIHSLDSIRGGYNTTSGGDGLDPSDKETIEKIRNSVNKYYKERFSRSEHSRARGGFPVVVSKLDGTHVGIFDTQADAAEQLGLPKSKVCWCVQGLRKHTKGYVIKRYENA